MRIHENSKKCTMLERNGDMRVIAMTLAFLFAIFLAGCASGDGGQVVSGILQGIGQGLSGL